MNSKIILPASLILMAAAALFCWRQRSESRKLQTSLAGTMADVAQYREQLAGVNKKLAAAESKLKSNQGSKADPQARRAEAELAMQHKAGYAAMRRLHDVQLITKRYENFRGVHLLPADVERLRTLLVDRLEAPSDVIEAAKQQGIADHSPEMGQAVTAALRNIDGEINGLLGDAEYQHLQEAQRDSAARVVVMNLVGRDMALAGLSLNESQLAAVTTAFLTSQQTLPSEAVPSAPDVPAEVAPWSKTFISQVSSALNPDQLDFLKKNVVLSEQTRLLYQAKPQIAGN